MKLLKNIFITLNIIIVSVTLASGTLFIAAVFANTMGYLEDAMTWQFALTWVATSLIAMSSLVIVLNHD